MTGGLGVTGPGAVLSDSGRPAAANTSVHAYHTASELIGALASRQISSRELVDDAIARIEALDAKINAVVVRDFDRAREAARKADGDLSRGGRAPLLGVPLTVKEDFRVAGLPMTVGYPKYRGLHAEADALVIQRLKKAGAIILGKTNVPVGLGDWQSYNDVYGTTNNPWDLTRTPGGSSGGSAAALAAGYVPLELGSDLGGSLRVPAHFCGVFSHKPTLDLVPLRGSGLPEASVIPIRGDLFTIGPMARSAVDLALELSVIAGPDELMEGVGYKLSLPPPRHDKLADFRVLVIDQHPLCPTAESIRAKLNEMVDRLAKAGCTILRNCPKLPDLALTARVYQSLTHAQGSWKLSPETRMLVEKAASALDTNDDSLVAEMLRGYTLSHAGWVRQSNIRAELRAHWQALFEDVDVMLCPPFSTQAFEHDHSPFLERKLYLDGTPIQYAADVMAWGALAPLVGLPSTTMPIGEDSGLPIGVQITGGYFEDLTTIGFAALVEREFGGFKPPPTRASLSF